MIKLSNGTSQVDIDLVNGGRISQIRIEDLALLVHQEDNPLAWGCYPMVPWVGRLQHGKLKYQANEYHFPLNMPPHAIHGTCFNRPWQVISDQTTASQSTSKNQTQLELSISLGEHWPFSGQAKQIITLNKNSLELSLSVHSDKDSFPASIGWHPWFNRQLTRGESAQLNFKAQKKYLCDDEQIPLDSFIEQGDGPWDDCFIEIERSPVLNWANALELCIESSCDHWVVYDIPKHALCVEPQTAAANALNAAPRIVSPNNPLCAKATLSWQLL
jgi:aldose 1-epimerase